MPHSQLHQYCHPKGIRCAAGTLNGPEMKQRNKLSTGSACTACKSRTDRVSPARQRARHTPEHSRSPTGCKKTPTDHARSNRQYWSRRLLLPSARSIQNAVEGGMEGFPDSRAHAMIVTMDAFCHSSFFFIFSLKFGEHSCAVARYWVTNCMPE